jgi:hypothetical protein
VHVNHSPDYDPAEYMPLAPERRRITPRSATSAALPDTPVPATALERAACALDEALTALALPPAEPLTPPRQARSAADRGRRDVPRQPAPTAATTLTPGPRIGRSISTRDDGDHVLVAWPTSAAARNLAFSAAAVDPAGPLDEPATRAARRLGRARRLARRIAAAARSRPGRAGSTSTPLGAAVAATDLVVAQAVADEIMLDAERESREILDDARLRIEQITVSAKAALHAAAVDRAAAPHGRSSATGPSRTR